MILMIVSDSLVGMTYWIMLYRDMNTATVGLSQKIQLNLRQNMKSHYKINQKVLSKLVHNKEAKSDWSQSCTLPLHIELLCYSLAWLHNKHIGWELLYSLAWTSTCQSILFGADGFHSLFEIWTFSGLENDMLTV